MSKNTFKRTIQEKIDKFAIDHLNNMAKNHSKSAQIVKINLKKGNILLTEDSPKKMCSCYLP